jgi:signal peptidase II
MVVVDQATKLLAVKHLEFHSGVAVLGDVLRLDLVRNSGAAFSLGAGGSTWLFTALAVLVVAGMLWSFPRIGTMRARIAAVLIMGGAAGNLIDRLLRAPGVGRGHVVDFVHIHGFPIFNVADMSITCGAVLFALTALWPHQPNPSTRVTTQ